MLLNNYIDYTSVLKKEIAIYDFIKYTPSFISSIIDDNDGWIKPEFFKSYNNVPKEMSELNLEKIEYFF